MANVAPKSEATKLYKKDMEKIKGTIVAVFSVAAILFLIAYCAVPVVRDAEGSIGGISAAREERRATEAAEAAARAEQVALARAEVNEELLRFNDGVWLLQGHTSGSEREVFMDSFSVDRDGDVEEFVFEYSITEDGKAYANTWSCKASQMNRYDCSVRQQFEGGSWRNEGQLVRESESSFSGRYLYERQWRLVSLVRKTD